MKCRMCKDREEGTKSVTSECIKLAQLEYKKRYDKVAEIVHWSLCEKYMACRVWKHDTDTRLNQ